MARFKFNLATAVALTVASTVLGSPVSISTIFDGLIPNDSSTVLDSRSNGISVMIVGDSITQGKEGDWTWRYRLWEWFNDQGVQVDCLSLQIFCRSVERLLER